MTNRAALLAECYELGGFLAANGDQLPACVVELINARLNDLEDVLGRDALHAYLQGRGVEVPE